MRSVSGQRTAEPYLSNGGSPSRREAQLPIFGRGTDRVSTDPKAGARGGHLRTNARCAVATARGSFRPDKAEVWSHYEEPDRPDVSARRATTVSSQRSARLRESRRAPGRMLNRDLDQLARPCRGQVRERQAVRGVRGKLRGSRSELTWHRLHALAPHQPSQPVACSS
jgi:hypothetical protein